MARVWELARPVPVSENVCGLAGVLSVIVTVPVRDPVAVGVKLTRMVQEAPGFKVAHEVVARKSPLAMADVIVAGTLPVLKIVIVWFGLVVPIACGI